MMREEGGFLTMGVLAGPCAWLQMCDQIRTTQLDKAVLLKEHVNLTDIRAN